MEDRMLDNDINIKKIIIIIISVVVLLFILIISILSNMRNGYVIVEESVVITKGLFGYRQITEIDKDVLNERYNVVSESNINKDVIINYSVSGSWTYFDNNYKDLKLSKVDVAYTNKFKNVQLIDYDFAYYESSDDHVIEKFIGNYQLNDFKDKMRKSIADFDNDGKEETIYTLDSSNEGDYYSGIFMVDDGKIVKIADSTKDSFMIYSVFDINNDKKYEILVVKGKSDVVTSSSNVQMYSIGNVSAKCIMNCR